MTQRPWQNWLDSIVVPKQCEKSVEVPLKEFQTCNNIEDCPLISTTPDPGITKWLPLVGPQFQNHVELRRTDGLMAFFISDYHPNMTTIQEQLLMVGYRDNSTIAKISVTFRFDTEFISKLHLFPKYALLILAARTINELNEIFEKSGTKIRLELHCIMPIEVISMKDYGVKNLNALLWLYNQQNVTKGVNEFVENTSITKGADLTLVFMDELNEETLGMSYYYKMADKKTTILIKRDAYLFILVFIVF